MSIVGANCAFRLDILNVQQAEDNARRTGEIGNSQASVRFAKGLKQKDLIFLRPWDRMSHGRSETLSLLLQLIREVRLAKYPVLI